MLRMVKKRFNIGNGITAMPGDIVDTSGWRNEASLMSTGYLMETDAKQATPKEAKKVVSTPSAPPAKKKAKKSVLAGHKRVFTRKAMQGV